MKKILFSFLILIFVLLFPDNLPSVKASSLAANKLKISIQTPGIYKIPLAKITEAGLKTNSIHLINQGNSIPFHLSETDLEFYGQAYEDYYTNTNVYFIEEGTPVLAGTLTVNASSQPSFFSYIQSLHLEENPIYWQNRYKGEGKEHWFWKKQTYSASSVITFSLSNIDFASTTFASVTAKLAGGSTLMQYVDIFLNNNLLKTGLAVDGYNDLTDTITFPVSYLQPGTNTLTFAFSTVGNQTGAVIYLDWAEIKYPHLFIPENNQIKFPCPGAGNTDFKIINFSNPDIQGWRVDKNDNKTDILGNLNIANNSVAFQTACAANYEFYFFTEEQKKSPLATEIINPDNLKSIKSADYIIITDNSLVSTNGVTALATYRQSKGLRVVTAEMNAIYYHFSHGLVTPFAIRDFLIYASLYWTSPAPKYAVLIGDALYDYKGYFSPLNKNLVPAPFAYSLGFSYTEIPSDNLLADIDEKNNLSCDDYSCYIKLLYPDLAIGRISAQNSADVENMVVKIINYEKDSSQNNKIAIVSGAGTSSVQDPLRNYLQNRPEIKTIAEINVDRYPEENWTDKSNHAKTDFVKNINADTANGLELISYVGHSDWQSWSGIYTLNYFDDPSLGLKNTQYPIISSNSCNAGFYNGLKKSSNDQSLSLMEKFIIHPFGAINSIGASDLTVTPDIMFTEILYKKIFEEKPLTIGEAFLTAKKNLPSEYLSPYSINDYQIHNWLVKFNLFGDPAVNIQTINHLPPSLMLSQTEIYAQENSPIPSIIVKATDADGRSLTPSIQNQPTNANLDPLTGLFTWTPAYDQAGNYTITFSANDGRYTVSKDLIIHVTNKNRPPVISLPQESIIFSENEKIEIQLTATDPDNDPVATTVANNPTGSTFDSQTNIFTWTPAYDQAGNYTITFTASDGDLTANTNLALQILNKNRAPLADPRIVKNQELLKETTFSLTEAKKGIILNGATFSADPDNEDILTYAWSIHPWYNKNKTIFSSTVPNPEKIIISLPGKYLIKLLVADQSGANDIKEINFTISAGIITNPAYPKQ